MAHMQDDITDKQNGWMVETNEGTCYVPGDVQPVPHWLSFSQITADDSIFDDLCEMVRDYVTGHDIRSIEVISAYYFARLSAPGYTDCTEWCAFKTIKEAREYLRDL